MAPTVVVLGGAFGGLHVAHSLLKHNKEVKVVLVSKSSHFFWNLASVRAIVPGTFDDSKLFVSVADALARYPKERVEFVVGTAEAVDTAAKTVRVSVSGGGGDDASRTLAYDHLVVATGSRNALPSAEGAAAAGDVQPLAPWKADGSYEDIQALLAATQAKVAAARHIVVVGGGATGVEVAAELGHAYGGKRKPAKDGDDADAASKEIVLLSAAPELLGGDAVAGAARAELAKLHVEVRTGRAVTAARTRAADGRIELTVTGEDAPIVTDLYLAATGMVPNTQFLDAALLRDDGSKAVAVDAFYRASAVASHDVWAVGDAVCQPRAGFFFTQKQAAAVAKNIDLALRGKPPQPVKLPPVDIFAVATGPARGVGRVGWLRLPSMAVAFAKSRTLGTQMLPSYLDGSVA